MEKDGLMATNSGHPRVRAIVQTLSTWKGGPWIQSVLLIATFGACFAMRASILFASPYPPSNDVAGELYGAHAWLGHSIPMLAGTPLSSPVFTFVVVIPSLWALPVFTAQRFYMSFLPALLVFPTYFLEREIGVGRYWSVLGAFMMGTATTIGLMVTWNGGSNTFGILLLLVFAALLVRTYRNRSLKTIAITGVTLALIAGADPISLIIGAITLVLSALLLILLTTGWRNRLEAFLLNVKVVVFATLFSLPFAFYYFTTLQGTSNAGVGSYWTNVIWFYSNTLFFPWGFQAVTGSLLAVSDIIVTWIGITSLLRSHRDVGSKAVVIGLLVASWLFPFVNASNAVRGLYFTTIPYVIAAIIGLERLSRAPAVSPVVHNKRPQRLRVPRWVPSGAAGRSHALRLPSVVAIALILAGTNLAYSVGLMTQSATFYRSLNSSDVAAMNWIRENTPTNATFYDAAGLQTWMWAYAERSDYAPQPLGDQVTALSYHIESIADLISLGTYLVGNDRFVVANNQPAGVGTPEIYLDVPGFWEPFLITDANSVSFQFAGACVNGCARLQFFTQVTSWSGNSTSSTAFDQTRLWSPVFDIGLNQTEVLSETGITLGWSSNTSVVQSVNASFAMPPSGYFFDYLVFPQVQNVTSLTDVFSYLGNRFSVTFSGGYYSQETLQTGWSQLTFSGGKTIELTVTGLTAQAGVVPFVMNTGSLLEGNSITYAISDSYDFNSRISANALGGPTATLLFSSGTVAVYRLNW